MTIIDTFKGAFAGWSALFSRRPDWREHFDFGAEGVNAAMLTYLGAVLIAFALQFSMYGMPAPVPMLLALIVHLLPAISLILVTMGARKLFGFTTPAIVLIVPGLYLHAVFMLVGVLLQLAGVGLAGALTGLLGFFLYKLARGAADLDIMRAVAYAVLNVIVLVGLPLALYISVAATVAPA